MDANGLGCKLIQVILPGEHGWRQISQPGLYSLSVVEDFNVLDDLILGLLPGGITPVVNKLIFQCTPEAFDGRIIVAVALSAHRGGHAELVK